jgi:hypothetical protein
MKKMIRTQDLLLNKVTFNQDCKINSECYEGGELFITLGLKVYVYPKTLFFASKKIQYKRIQKQAKFRKKNKYET